MDPQVETAALRLLDEALSLPVDGTRGLVGRASGAGAAMPVRAGAARL